VNTIVWGVFFQLDINPNTGNVGWIEENLRDAFLIIYYIEHNLILAFGFLLNLILLGLILKKVKDSNRKVSEITFSSNQSFTKEEGYLAFSLSLYIIPFLICAIWQVIGYTILSIMSISDEKFFRDLFQIVVYPYSFFFPLQGNIEILSLQNAGLLNCLVFYFNKKKFGEVLKKCCFCSLEGDDDEEEEEVVIISKDKTME
jgi:hypothetical protein